jgi:hypothetical protein
MRVYHTNAPGPRPAQRRLHPKTRFTIHGDTLRRTIDDNERLLVHVPALALAVPVDVLLDAESAGVRFVLLTDENGQQYRARLDAFWRTPSFAIDRGFGKQRALPLSAMTDPHAPETPTQGVLFEVTLA